MLFFPFHFWTMKVFWVLRKVAKVFNYFQPDIVISCFNNKKALLLVWSYFLSPVKFWTRYHYYNNALMLCSKKVFRCFSWSFVWRNCNFVVKNYHHLKLINGISLEYAHCFQVENAQIQWREEMAINICMKRISRPLKFQVFVDSGFGAYAS